MINSKHMYNIGLRVEVILTPSKSFNLGLLDKVTSAHVAQSKRKQLGTITSVEKALGLDTPVITLDNGSMVRGYECWWKPIRGTVKITKPN